MKSAFGIEHGISKAIGRKELVHIAQVGDHVRTPGYEMWSATHPHDDISAVRNELTRRSSRRAKLSGAYSWKQVSEHPAKAGDRPIGHGLSSYRPVLSRKRVKVGVPIATGAVGAGTTAGVLVARHRRSE